jgi:hypothetical protein
MEFFFYGGNWNSGARGDYLFAGEALAAGCVMVIADNRPADYQFKAIVKDMDVAYQELLLDHITPSRV